MDKWLDAALDYIPSWLEFQLRLSGQPGCAIAIAHRDRIVLERAFGYADCHTGEALTPRHRFRVASQSKSFTAAGVMKLRELGKLRLDDPVGKYVSALNPKIARAKISEVLSHGAGIIRDGDDCGYFYDRRPYPTANELLSAFGAPPLVKPNTRLKYSNHGFGLLGLMIEAITGEPFTSWVKRQIVDAVGLKETTPDMPIPRGVPFARGHTGKLPTGMRAVIPGEYSSGALAPASGIVSTVRDMASFFAQLSPLSATSILSAASRRDIIRRRWRYLHTSVKAYYGFGTIIGSAADWDWFGHSGGLPGYVSVTKMLPEQHLTVSVLGNSTDAPVESWIGSAIHILQTFQSRGPSSAKVRDWNGRWWNDWGAIDLVPMGNTVLMASPHLGNPFLDVSELQVLGKDKARVAVSPSNLYEGEAVRRVRDQVGRVSALWVGGDNFVPEAERAAEIEKRYGASSGNSKH